jgi:hypothetical protein
MIDAWQFVKDAGPLALAAAFFLIWWLERKRADEERGLNKELTERVITAIEAATTAVKDLRGVFRRTGGIGSNE